MRGKKMSDLKLPKRTAIMLVSLLFVAIYTVSVILLVVLRSNDSELLSGNVSENSSLLQSETSSLESSSDTGSDELQSSPSSSEDTSSETVSEETPDSSEPTAGGTGTESNNSSSEPENNNNSNNSNSSGGNSSANDTSSVAPPPPTVTPSSSGFGAALWISICDMDNAGIKGKTKAQFQEMIDTMFDNAVSIGIDTLFCQVRPFSDALYKSSYFPYSKYLTGTQGKDPGYDPLEIMVSAAHKRNLEIHAWINPYRISADSTDISILAPTNPARKWWTDGDPSNDRYVLTDGKGLYYNPAILEVQKLIINGIREICENYDVDGIHIDDYFYPSSVTDSFDSVEYNASGTKLSLADWRRANVNALVTGMYSAVKSYGLTFGISPAGNITRNYNSLYADIEKWISTSGYTDYIMPQLYYGYEYPTAKYAYANLLNDWMKLTRLPSVKIYIGLANYKIDTVETVGSVTSTEWIDKNDIIARQTKDAYDKKADGVVLFSYGSVFGNSNNQKTQTEKFKEVIKQLK